MSQTLSDPTANRTSSRGGWLSRYARRRKLEYFFRMLPSDAHVLDFGTADGWVSRWAEPRGWTDITGIDLVPPADIVGDIHDWRSLGLAPHSYDAIVAFEVVEHGDFAEPLRALLKPSGVLLATTPVPHFDWVCKCLESVRVLQPRTSAHANLLDLRTYPGFRALSWQTKGLISQWGVLTPAEG